MPKLEGVTDEILMQVEQKLTALVGNRGVASALTEAFNLGAATQQRIELKGYKVHARWAAGVSDFYVSVLRDEELTG